MCECTCSDDAVLIVIWEACATTSGPVAASLRGFSTVFVRSSYGRAGAVGQKPKKPPNSSDKKRSAAKLQLQQDNLGLGLHRGPSSDLAFNYEGGSKTSWKDELPKFESSALANSTLTHNELFELLRCTSTSTLRLGAALPSAPASPTYDVRYVVQKDTKNNKKWQQSTGGALRPRVLHNFRAFDPAKDKDLFGELDIHAMKVASQQTAYQDLKHLLWALSAGDKIKEECELVRYAPGRPAAARHSSSLALFCSLLFSSVLF